MIVLFMFMISSFGLDNEGWEFCKLILILYVLDMLFSSGLICLSLVFCKVFLIFIILFFICLCKWWKVVLEGVNILLSLIKMLCSR